MTLLVSLTIIISVIHIYQSMKEHIHGNVSMTTEGADSEFEETNVNFNLVSI